MSCQNIFLAADTDGDGFVSYPEYHLNVLAQVSPYENCPPARQFGVILPAIYREFHTELCELCTSFDSNPSCCDPANPLVAVPGPGSRYGETYSERICTDMLSFINEQCPTSRLKDSQPPTSAPIFVFQTPNPTAPIATTAIPVQSPTLQPSSRPIDPIEGGSPTISPIGDGSPTGTDVQPRSGGNNGRTAAAIAIPLVLLAIIACLLGAFFYRRRRDDPTKVSKTGDAPEAPQDETFVDPSETDHDFAANPGTTFGMEPIDRDLEMDEDSMGHTQSMRELLDTLEAQNAKLWYNDPDGRPDTIDDESMEVDLDRSNDPEEEPFEDEENSADGSQTRDSTISSTNIGMGTLHVAEKSSPGSGMQGSTDEDNSGSGNSGSGEWESVFIGGQMYSQGDRGRNPDFHADTSEDERGWSDSVDTSDDEDLPIPPNLLKSFTGSITKLPFRRRSLTPPPRDQSIPHDDSLSTPERAEPDDSEVTEELWSQQNEGGVYMV